MDDTIQSWVYAIEIPYSRIYVTHKQLTADSSGIYVCSGKQLFANCNKVELTNE